MLLLPSFLPPEVRVREGLHWVTQFSTEGVAEGGLSAAGTLPFFSSAPLLNSPEEIPAALRKDLICLPAAS